MGILDRLSPSSQFIEVIEWLDDSPNTLLYRFPVKDQEIKNGAQLIVRESQAAVFVHEGQIADQFPPGRYTIQAEFPGFQTRILKDVQLKVGDNKHVAVLAIEGFSDSVTVSRDAREAASDRRSTFATAMPRARHSCTSMTS